MASYLDTYVGTVFALTIPTDALQVTIYGPNTSTPSIPDLTNVIAVSDTQLPPVTSPSPPLTRFTFSSEPVLVTGGSYWLAIAPTGAVDLRWHFRLYEDAAFAPMAIQDSSLSWTTTPAGSGFAGELVVMDITIFNRAMGAVTQDFAVSGGVLVAEEFVAIGPSADGARIWKRI